MNKKIGLISYHRDPNYGTMLQAFALAYSIRKLGEDCEYLNYYEYKRPSVIKRIISKFYRLIKRLLNLRSQGEYDYFNSTEFATIKDSFDEFHKQYIPFSEHKYYYDTIGNAEDKYKFFIVGSDQTWSQEVNRIGTTINFLDFVKQKNKKRSYAPSIGSVHIDNSYLQSIVPKLHDFQFISCRERPNCEKLEQVLQKQVEYVLDPTLLLSPAEWEQFLTTPLIEGRYILAYILGTRECISKYAEHLGEIYNIPVYYILTRPEYSDKRNVLRSIGPFDFINLIKNSKFVVTDSFHGTIFSINFEKDFYCFAKRDGGIGYLDNDRIETIVQEFNLEKRLIKDEVFHELPKIDYSSIRPKVNHLRESSIQYLKKITE